MKYRFITILHNLKLSSIKNKGTQLFQGCRISNGEQILLDTLGTQIAKETLGWHSINEFYGSTYLYMDGTFSDIQSEEEAHEIGTKQTFTFLRKAQDFVHNLWEVKDNNVYVRDGFLIIYEDKLENGGIYKASLSETFSRADCKKYESLFNDSEIASALIDFEPPMLSDYDTDNFGGKFPDSDHLFKTHGSDRFTRARYFIISARRSAILPMKVLLYCTALESLFTIGNSEVTHKTAERVAIMLGTTQREKKDLFQLIKKAYGYRSKIIHGQYLKGTDERLVKISVELDDVLRKLIINNDEVFYKDDNEMDEHFIELIFEAN